MSRFVLTAQLQLQAPTNVGQIVSQIQSQLSNISVNLQVQGSAQATRQIQQVNQACTQATTTAERMGQAFAVSIRRFAAFSIATRAVGLFTSTLSEAVQTAINFERQLVKLSQVTGDSLDKLKGLTKTITGLATGFGVSSQSLLETSTALLQAGISAKDTKIALESLAKSALAPNFDSLSQTTEGAIAILAQFRLGVGALEDQLGSINAVAGAFAVEASDLIDVVRRTGGVFKSSGGNLNELLALFTSVRATTRESAESIGTGLRTIFTRIQRPKTIEYLKQFGVELVDLEGKFVGPYEAVRRLSGALSGLGEGDITFIRIAEELGGFRQIGKVLPLLQQFATAEQALNVATQANGSLTKDAATAQQALAIRITKVKEEFLALVRGITETPAFQIMANTALALASALIKVGESLKPLLPLLTAVMAVKVASGLGSFLGSVGRGLGSGRAYNQGGRVRKFATGGLVPGVGDGDTVPAMLSPGEFVIRKSSVQKLGANNLAHMNRGGEVQKFVLSGQPIIPRSGTPAKSRLASLADDELKLLSSDKSLSIAGKARVNNELKKRKKGFENQDKLLNAPKFGLVGLFGNPYGPMLGVTPNTKTQVSIQGARLNKKESKKYEGIMKSDFINTIKNIGTKFAAGVGAKPKLEQGFLNDVIKKSGFYNAVGAYLESSLALVGAPFEKDSINAPIDFPSGLGAISSKFGVPSNIPTDVTRTIGSGGKNNSKFLAQVDRYLVKNNLASLPVKKHFGGIIQKFATGGRAKGIEGAPLVDDILQASGSILPRPSMAIQALIKAGGGAVDVDRTLKRTIGDTAYAKAPTSGAKNASLETYFRDENKRLQDLKTAPVTQFGKELQAAIKNGQLNARKVSIISKSKRVKGAAEYLSSQFGIPVQNMIFTQGGSKQPALDAIRTKGPRIDRIARFAVGGGVGTDTIPALLTPGEFVVNSKSAQRIGYGNLNRMNKVGKYANGGIVQHFASGTGTAGAQSVSGGGMANINSSIINLGKNISILTTQIQGLISATQKLNTSALTAASSQQQASQQSTTTAATTQQTKSIKESVAANKMFAASMTVGLLQGFLPALDENSSAVTKMSHNLLGLVSTVVSVGFALEAFGVSLTKKSVMNFISGRGISTGGALKRGVTSLANGAESIGMTGLSTLLKGMAPHLAKFAFGLTKLLGPLALAATAFMAVKAVTNALSEAFFGDAKKMKDAAIARGDVEAAGQQAQRQATGGYEGAAGNVAAGAVAGAILGGPLGAGVGAAVGAAISAFGILQDRVTGATTQAVNLAEAQAGAVKSALSLQVAENQAARAMEDFKNGTGTALDVLMSFQGAGANIQSQRERVDKVVSPATQNGFLQGGRSEYGSGAILRNFGAYLGGGLLGMETADTRNKRLSASGVESVKTQRDMEGQYFAKTTESRNATIRSGFARGKSEEDIKGALKLAGMESPSELRDRSVKVKQQAEAAKKAGDSNLENELNSYATMLEQEAKNGENAFKNIGVSVNRAREAFDALNLGLRATASTAAAQSATMTKFAAGLEVGGSQFVNNVAFLDTALSSAAQAMNDVDIKAAVKGISDELKNTGIDPSFITKFEGNITAFTQAQVGYNKAFDNVKKSISANDFNALSPEELKTRFADELVKGMGGDVSDEAKLNLKKIIKNIELSPEEVDQILNNNFSVFGEKMGEAGRKQLEDLKKIADDRAKAEKTLIDLTQKQIDAQRNFLDAQKEALSLTMEGREVQGKYGGKAVTYDERKQNILAKANANGVGLADMKTGSVKEFQDRNAQMKQKFAELEAKRKVQGGMTGVKGVKDDAAQKDIQAAYKDQIGTIRELIKLEEENLKLVQEKNRVEKESLQALVSGDIEKYFEQQAAAGATAAIATGNETLMNAFGPKALGDAFANIQKQQEAGVESIYGKRIGGVGGLGQTAAEAALKSRGINDPSQAQKLAGTTAEEEQARANLRGLGKSLSETGALGEQMAEMQIKTATINVEGATFNMEQIEARGGAAGVAAQGRAMGGLIYANNGIFVPRGTDTVPAMLTPGEFVVRREAVNRGNNLQLLHSLNNGTSGAVASGFARGGKVQYYSSGGVSTGGSSFDTSSMEKLTQTLSKVMEYVNSVAESIKSLPTTIQHQMADAKVHVNVLGGDTLNAFADNLENRVMNKVSDKLRSSYPTETGIKENRGVLQS
jgi:TP901 family phage tail tape measure protein